MFKRVTGIVAAVIAAAVMLTAAPATADAASFSRELTAVAQAAGVSEETVYSMAVSLVSSDPEDEYRFPDEEFQDAPRSWSAVLAFVKRFWRQIVDAAKAAGEWAWWKAGKCATGAVTEVWNKFGGDLTDPEAVLAVAVYGCLKGLRG
ncbi:hypothetical protein OG884_31715 [Streptosporangium sp. NBC_01755]|uniref:hypothetical protein n=1 Tax=unclassified Streptosporangium TaxID=2632669 RepID=UPI002DD94B88|nr:MULTISPECIES: hypothetical protein [unclassified Streptosporangium]WSA29205.1 hypothetical protein OIE13_15785 [Streptosporangium sp. NBC_01810]WSC99351.1 hypothetical protein OG884_31715 [Streptosporangium sp. NBC_01755]